MGEKTATARAARSATLRERGRIVRVLEKAAILDEDLAAVAQRSRGPLARAVRDLFIQSAVTTRRNLIAVLEDA